MSRVCLVKHCRWISVLIALGMVAVSTVTYADSWWQTPEQQAQAAFESGDVELLRQVAPSTAWQGVAESLAGEHATAIEQFSVAAEQQRLAGNRQDALRSLYNRGVSEVKAGRYQQALDTFNEVLDENPGFDDARHNRDIAERLLALQNPPPESQQSSNSDNNSSDSADGSDQNNGSEQPQNGQGEGQGNNSSDSQQANNQNQAGSTSQDSAAQTDAGLQQADADRDAREALQAEATQSEGIDQGNDETGERAPTQEQPLSESQQATEQWLRRIPDDPSGLLRRKLEHNHRMQYPEVGNARQPW